VTYRDEKDSLRAENERLRVALEGKRPRRPWVAMGLALIAVAALVLLLPWLNGTDERFWGALAILGVLGGGAVFAALRQV
jgi:hypothetical protein